METGRSTYTGNLHPWLAAGLAPLFNLQLYALEATELERRIAKAEKLLARAEAAGQRVD